MSVITSNMRSVVSNDIIDQVLESAFPALSVNVYEVIEDILNPTPDYGLKHHNFKVVEYKSLQYVIEVKSLKGFECEEIFMCWISGGDIEIKMAYGKSAAIRLVFEILTS